MVRFSSSVIVTAIVGLVGCGSPVLSPLSETAALDQTRPGGGQAGEDEPLTPSPQSAPMVGTITAVSSQHATVTFLIESHPDQPLGPEAVPATTGDKYDVMVTAQTRIRRRAPNGDSMPATPNEIQVGMRAEVWFVGPILRSYPAQGTAGRIMLLDPY